VAIAAGTPTVFLVRFQLAVCGHASPLLLRFGVPSAHWGVGRGGHEMAVESGNGIR
jgi:hypothetical protein